MMLKIWITTLITCIVASTAWCSVSAVDSDTSHDMSTRPFCGLNSVYAALRISGYDCQLHDLMSSHYISNEAGSTMLQLHRAITDQGAHAKSVSGLTPSNLVTWDQPAILHVRQDPFSRIPDHFVVYMGHAGDQELLILDAPELPRYWSYDELRAVWGGTAILVSKSDVDFAGVFRFPWKWIACVLLIGVVLFIGDSAIQHPLVDARRPLSLVTLQVLFVIAVAACSAFADLVLSDANGLRSDEVSAVSMRPGALPDEYIDLDDMLRLCAAKECVLIDARMPVDYSQGHIEGARSVPVNLSRAMRRRIVSDLSSGTQIVVYCQSKRCNYASVVARQLRYDGFTNVRVMTEGMNGWRQASEQGRTK